MSDTIDQVITDLSEVIDRCREKNSRLGYFAALYRKVTIEVQKGIKAGRFEDGPRMEKLDVIFASRYLNAYHAYQKGERPTASWAFAFAAARRRRLIVLQHLLLGMNAHINLDLGIAAAQSCPGNLLPPLRRDFNTINELLASLVEDVQRELAEVWPGLGILLTLIRKSDDVVVNFSMKKARDAAWSVAEELSPVPLHEQQARISRLDQQALRFAERISLPGAISGATLLAIRLRERGSVREIIDILT